VTRVQPIRSQIAATGSTVPGGYGPLAEQEALDTALRGVGKVHLVGWAAGGREALGWAARHPDRVASLTVVEPTAFGLLSGTDIAAEAAESLTAVQALFDRVGGGVVTPADVAEYAERSAMAEPGEPATTHFRWPDWLANKQALSLEKTLSADGLDVTDLKPLSAPTLLVQGEHTAAHHRAVVERLAATVPSATVGELPGGHACHLENLDAFLALLARTLTAGEAR
jgi:pimeloyl-ACP methyl ester carboxylesterase